jgi:hypothetical protein
MNPQFFLNVSDPDPFDEERNCPVVVSLLQQQVPQKFQNAKGRIFYILFMYFFEQVGYHLK